MLYKLYKLHRLYKLYKLYRWVLIGGQGRVCRRLVRGPPTQWSHLATNQPDPRVEHHSPLRCPSEVSLTCAFLPTGVRSRHFASVADVYTRDLKSHMQAHHIATEEHCKNKIVVKNCCSMIRQDPRLTSISKWVGAPDCQ